MRTSAFTLIVEGDDLSEFMLAIVEAPRYLGTLSETDLRSWEDEFSFLGRIRWFHLDYKLCIHVVT